MNCKTTLILIVGLLIFSSPAWAQQDTTRTVARKPKPSAPRLDIIPMGGYVWTISQGAVINGFGGDIDFKSSSFYGIAVDLYAAPGIQGRLLYRRQETKLTFKRLGATTELADVSIDFWHIGVVKGITKGKVKPFTSFTIGGTRYGFSGESAWKFSAILGLGAKIHINEKLGLMVSGQMPFAFTGAFLGIGTGGVSVGGTGIGQFDVAAGLMITR